MESSSDPEDKSDSEVNDVVSEVTPFTSKSKQRQRRRSNYLPYSLCPLIIGPLEGQCDLRAMQIIVTIVYTG